MVYAYKYAEKTVFVSLIFCEATGRFALLKPVEVPGVKGLIGRIFFEQSLFPLVSPTG